MFSIHRKLFSFQKGSNHKKHSSSGPLHPVKKSPPPPAKSCLPLLTAVWKMLRNVFSQPQSKSFLMWRQVTLGLKLVCSFPATSIRHSQRNCRRLPRCLVKQIQRLLDDFSKNIAEALLRWILFPSFCLSNYIANDFIAEIWRLQPVSIDWKFWFKLLNFYLAFSKYFLSGGKAFLVI